MCKFRDLRAEEIECRVQSVKANGLVLLLYKDARVDMNILDETVGSSNWQNKFYENKGILFCSLGINTNFDKPDLPDRWVWKDDAGVESNTEAEKGNASDARKRAGFAWGIGRELYTAPFTWIPADKCNISEGKNGSKQCYDTTYLRKVKNLLHLYFLIAMEMDQCIDPLHQSAVIGCTEIRRVRSHAESKRKNHIQCFLFFRRHGNKAVFMEKNQFNIGKEGSQIVFRSGTLFQQNR